MVDDAELAERDFEECTLDAMVVVGEVEGDQHVGVNVEVLNGCGGDGVGLGSSKGICGRGGGVGDGRTWTRRHGEQREQRKMGRKIRIVI